MSENKTADIYYAVKQGREPGVYQTWKEAEKQTYLFSGADVKKFFLLADAEAYLNTPNPFTIEEVVCGAHKVNNDISVAVTSSFETGRTFLLDSGEYTVSFALLEALTDYLETYLSEHLYKPSVLRIVVGDTHAYNILASYLEKWKSNLFMTTKGPAPHPELLEALYTVLHRFNSYEPVFNKYHPLYVECQKQARGH
jgi:hypothetical protein